MSKGRWGRWAILLVISFMWVQCGFAVKSFAADSGDNLVELLGSENLRTYQKPKDSEEYWKGNGYGLDDYDQDLRIFPILKSVRANHVKNNRVTSKTNSVVVKMGDHASIAHYANTAKDRLNYIIGFRAALLTGGKLNNIKVPIKTVASSEKHAYDPMSITVWPSAEAYKFSVNLSDMHDNLPLQVVFQIETAGNPNHWMSYTIGTFLPGELQKKPTITDGPTPDSLTVMGTGTPDSTITSDVNNQTATVGSDGKYKISVASGLEAALRKNHGITIFETNDFGDSASVSQQQLTMPIAEENSTFQIEDSLSYEKQATDDQVIDDLRKRLKIKIASDDPNFNEDVHYGSTQKNLADLINQQQVGTTVEIPIYATKPGYIRSNNVVVKVTKNTSNVIFTNNKAYLDFKRHPIPLKPNWIWSDDVWKLSVIDDRVKERTKWSLTAKATETVQDTKTPKTGHVNDLSNYLWYQSSEGQTQQLNQGVTILTSEMAPVSGQPNLFEHKFSGKNGSGIFVKAVPNMVIGSYSATITWTLQLAPTS